MNDPSEAAASVAGTGSTICPPIMKTIGELTLNPVPMTCTVLPTLTLAGVKVIVGMTRVNDAVATFPDASVTVNVFVAAAVSGIANVAESPPVLLVVDELKVIAAPLTFAVTALSAANPVAVAVMVVPLLPVLGVTSIDGPTVIAVWTIKPVFESVMVSRYVPAKMLGGTMNVVVVVNALAPFAVTVCGPNAEVAIKSIPPNDAVESADRPVMVMLTLLADFAVVGATIVGVPITVRAAVAVSVGTVAVSCRE